MKKTQDHVLRLAFFKDCSMIDFPQHYMIYSAFAFFLALLGI